MRIGKVHVVILAGVAAGALTVAGLSSRAAEEGAAGEFASATIDLGVAVSNIEASARFYTEAVGFKEVPGFDVPADMGADSGLTDAKAFKVRVFVLGSAPAATKLKLIQFADARKIDNSFVHSSLGFRYLTIHVADQTAAMARLQKAGVKPLAKGPYALPDGFPKGVYLTLVRDPDGNLVELVGPKK